MKPHHINHILLTAEQIRRRLDELVKEMVEQCRSDRLVMIGILRGSFMFLADLVRALHLHGAHPRIDFITLESYGSGTESSGTVVIRKDINVSVKGADVLLVDDILDTGRTLAFACDLLRMRGAATLRTCTLLDKPGRRVIPFHADYVGFQVDDHFVVGYGLDYDNYYRELPYLAKVTFTAMENIEEKARRIFAGIHAPPLKAPRTIVFGSGLLNRLPALVDPMLARRRVLLVATSQPARSTEIKDRVAALLRDSGVTVIPYLAVGQEPTPEIVDQGAALARESQPDVVLGIGGGSVIDTAKAIAALATNPGSVEDYLEGLGTSTLAWPTVPLVAVPTAAGTGAEMTKNAVICSAAKGYKKSMRDERMIAAVALIDPQLTLTAPADVTAAGGMDAITQLIEACISSRRRPEVTALAHQGLRGCRMALRLALAEPASLPAREQLALSGAISGICLANAGLAMAHGVAAALGALLGMRHGLACAILLPHMLRYNRTACVSELTAALAAFLDQEQLQLDAIDCGIAALDELNRELRIPADLRYLRLTEAQVRRIAEASMGSSMAGNPIPMTPDMVFEFLRPITLD